MNRPNSVLCTGRGEPAAVPSPAAPRPRFAVGTVSAPSSPPRRGLPGPGPATRNAPSVGLPMRLMVLGLLSLFIGAGLLVWRADVLANYHYGSQVLAITHVFTLGFISSIIMGAMYQLVPVALEAKLFSERLGRWQFVMHAAGVAGMVPMFWVFNLKQVGHFGSLVGLGIGLFVYNLTRTLARVPRWTVIASAVAAALFWLCFTMLAGLYVAAAKSWNFSPFHPMAQMHAHAHVGIIGFCLMLIVGVSYKLVPMFTISDLQSPKRAAWSIGLLNAGVAGLFVTILLQSAFKTVFAVVVAAGLAIYGRELAAILRARRRRELDWGLKAFLAGIILVGPLTVLGVILSWPGLPLTELTGQLENLYGFLALAGMVALAILGMLYKILPFLVWYAVYSREVGRHKVPSLAELYSTRLQVAGFVSYGVALGVISVAIVMSRENLALAGTILLAASLAVFTANLATILGHLWRPRLQPLALNTNLKPNV